MKNTSDVIIVGGGFAGVIAARELSHAGKRVVLLEARDRLGGRTWTTERFNRQLELGGTWVHWLQPHVWAEITRYHLAVTESPVAQRGIWIAGNERHTGSVEDLYALLEDGMRRLCQDARVYFERPYDPFFDRGLESIDAQSITDRLKTLGLSQEQYELNEGMWSTHFNAPCSEGALTQGLRWYALASWDWKLLLEACGRYKFENGTKSLLDAIVADSRAEIWLSSPIAMVSNTASGVKVQTRSGEEFWARAAIITVPLNALCGIDFSPALSAVKRAAAADGQTSRGLKVWIKIRGESEPFLALAPSFHKLTLVQYEYRVPGGSILVGFGADAQAFDSNDPAAVQAVVRGWLPDAEVEACTGYNWVADPFSRETWPMLRPNQLTRYLPDLQRPEGDVFLAGSDYALGWGGFIDGAIESGITTARKIIQLLGR